MDLEAHAARKAARRAVRAEFKVRRDAGLIIRQRERLARMQTSTNPTITQENSTVTTQTETEATTAPTRHCSRWTPEEIATVTSMRADRYRAEDIALVLGRSKHSVYVVLYKLREAERDSFCCSRCRVTKPAAEFTASNRWRGARCRACCHEVVALASAERRRSATQGTD